MQLYASGRARNQTALATVDNLVLNGLATFTFKLPQLIV